MALITPTNDLTGNTIASTYDQLLFIDGTAITNSTLYTVAAQAGETALRVANDQILIKDSSGTDIASLFEVQDTDANVILSINGTNNRVGIGTAIPDTNLEVTQGGANCEVRISCHSDNAAHSGYLAFEKCDNTEASPHVVSEDEVLGVIQFKGMDADGGTYLPGAEIIARTNAGVTSGDMPCDLEFWTNTGGTATTQRMTILEGGNVGIGTTAPANIFNIEGTSIDTNPMNTSSLAASCPSILIQNTTNTADTFSALQMIANEGSNNQSFAIINQATSAGGSSGSDDYATYSPKVYFARRTQNDLLTPIMTFSEAGLVGIGTTTPDSELEIVGISVQTEATITTYSAGDTNASELSLRKSAGTTDGTPSATANNEDLGIIRFSGTSDESTDAFKTAAYIQCEQDSAAAADMSGRLSFVTYDGDSAVNAMTIKKDGKVGIGIAAPSHFLDVEGSEGSYVARFHNTNTANTADGIRVDLSHSDPDGGYYLACHDNNQNLEGGVRGDGDAGLSLEDASDRRLKENILDLEDGLAMVNQLKPRLFNFKKSANEVQIGGFIADEFDIIPKAIHGKRDGNGVLIPDAMHSEPNEEGNILPFIQMISVTKVIPYLTSAIQELSAKVTALENA